MRRRSALAAAAAPVVATAVHDLLQKRHTVTRNFPVVGHARFWLERIGPELRQYIVAANDEERPFSRDQLNVGREAMLAIGCIQAQKCHTDHCPTGVATQNAWLSRGLDPTVKSVRAANYVKTLRRDLLKLAESVGAPHPGLVTPDDLELLDGMRSASLAEQYGYEPHWGMPSEADRAAVATLMSATAPEGDSAPPSATAQS